jgi:hypothetical protein
MTPQLENIVYLKTGINKEAKIITGILTRKDSITYELTYGTESSWHFDFEFSDRPTDGNKKIRGLKNES